MPSQPAQPDLLDQLLALPNDERARLAKALIESLEDDEADPNWEELWSAEIVRRIEEGEKHPERLVTWEEAKARILANRR
jgi:putative addiction module component (TIGR02574 family)